MIYSSKRRFKYGQSSQQGPPPLPTKKTSPVVWIIVGVLGLVAVAGVVVIAGGLFLVNKAKDAAAKNPALRPPS
jgi:hypothetical protein